MEFGIFIGLANTLRKISNNLAHLAGIYKRFNNFAWRKSKRKLLHDLELENQGIYSCFEWAQKKNSWAGGLSIRLK